MCQHFVRKKKYLGPQIFSQPKKIGSEDGKFMEVWLTMKLAIVPLRWKRCAEETIQTKNGIAICTVELEKNK